MVASVFEVLVSAGDAVEAEQELIILESMKMEVPVTSESAGTVQEVLVEQSASVSEGDVLLRIEVA
jgi:acetyl-CoA carboxylase biotin carboxyl carrier protein